MDRFVAVAKALSDESRVRALMCLRRGELCLCQFIEMLGLAPSTVSRHMAVLQRAGLVRTRKEGRWTYYSLPGPEAPAAVRGALGWAQDALRRDATAREDARRLKAVRKIDREKLCGHYRK